MTFIDEFSHKTWIYFLKKKDEPFMWFRTFKSLVENSTGKKIKILRIDNGTEYETKEFNKFRREVGIRRENTIIYTLEQNGVAERKNRTIVGAFYAMLCDQGLPKFLWGEAVNIAVCIQNLCSHSALDSKTPKEVCSGKKPDVSYFRVFGCPVYFHVPKEKRSKLDASGKKGMFVGYSETSKAYRVYVPGQREVEICHDVTFDENASLRKVINLSSSEEDHDVRSGNQEEPKDEMMPDVEGPMDPIDPPPSMKRRPTWL